MAAVGTARSPAATEVRSDRSPPIANHGLITDPQTAALIAKDSTVDWYCCLPVDPPSVFASLLDHNRSGHFQVHGRKQCQHVR